MGLFRRKRAGWWLDNGEDRNRAAPRTYFIPPREDRTGLTAGRKVKLAFAFEPRDYEGGRGMTAERMWVQVLEARDDGTYVGALDNLPRLVNELKPGDRIEFGPEHVIAIEYSDEELGYRSGDAAFIDARIVEDDLPPRLLMTARPPDAEQDHWFAGLEPEPPARRRAITLGELTDRWPELEPVFRSAGGRWVRDDETGEYQPVG